MKSYNKKTEKAKNVKDNEDGSRVYEYVRKDGGIRKILYKKDKVPSRKNNMTSTSPRALRISQAYDWIKANRIHEGSIYSLLQKYRSDNTDKPIARNTFYKLYNKVNKDIENDNILSLKKEEKKEGK